MFGIICILIAIECVIIFKLLLDYKARLDVLESHVSFLMRSIASPSVSDDLSDMPSVDDFTTKE